MTSVVWLTTAYPWSDEPVGGVFHRTQACELVAAGVEVTVVTPTPYSPWPLRSMRPQWRRYADAPARQDDAGVVVVRPRYANVPGQPSWAGPDARIAGAMWRSRAVWRGAQLVHAHYSIAGLAAARVARRASLPLVLTFHGSDLNTWPDEFPERLDDLREAVRHASLRLVVSAPLAARLEALTGETARVLPIGVDRDALRAAALPRDEARRRLGLHADAPTILFAGNLLPAKGVRALVDAVARLDPVVRLELLGAGPEWGYGLDEPRLAGRIAYRGQQPPSAIPTWLSAADLVALPSHREGLPTILVEAGAIGVPVVASRVGGIPDLLADGRGTLLDDVSADAIEAGLRAALGDPAAAIASAERLRDHVGREYDAGVNARRLAAAYDEVLAR